MKIEILRLHIENFKGVKVRDIEFSENTKICGANATGKTTIFDAVTWLLFGKDSHDTEKFDLRPLDADGKQIDFVEISVVGTFRINGEEVELKKVQKQNWVKKHGTDKPKFEGNINECYIDGYPRSDKEYKAYIADIISNDLFKMLTNPIYFPTMKWKEQRALLMSLAGEITDVALAEKLGGFDELIPEIKKAPSLEDIGKKYGKSVKELKADIEEIPVRIDELSKQIVDYDVAELELSKSELMRRKADSSNEEELKVLRDKLAKIEKEIDAYTYTANADLHERRAKANGAIVEVQRKQNEIEHEIGMKRAELSATERAAELKSEMSKSLGEQYKAEKEKEFPESEWVFDEKSETCATCGQKLPANKINEIHAEFKARKMLAVENFEARKKKAMDEILSKGYALKEEIKSLQTTATTLKAEIKDLEEKALKIRDEITRLTNNASKIPACVDLSADKAYLSLTSEKALISAKIEELSTMKVDTSEIDSELADVNRKLLESSNNEMIENRISALQEEQRNKAQLIANAEKMLYLLETFTKAKLEAVAESINSKFSVVKFKLFDVQINGGVNECCECTVNGVPYSDLNSGHKIVAGLDIIKSLSAVFDTTAFIFIDNAESVNEFNLPAMDCQTIRLIVTEDTELIVNE